MDIYELAQRLQDAADAAHNEIEEVRELIEKYIVELQKGLDQ